MDCNFTTIKTCELKDSAFRSRILDFGDFDISDYTFSAVYKAGFDQIISEQEITPVGNILTVPLEAIESASNRAKVEVWMFRVGGFKDKVVVFDVVISATGCPSDSTITEGISVTFGGLTVPVTVTQAVYMNVTEEQLAAIAQPAIEAAELANQAATSANTAAGLATDATSEAVTATGQATSAAQNANEAAESANQAAEAANEAAGNALTCISGEATQSNSPEPTGFHRYIVTTPITTGSSWGIAVTQAELNNNWVFFNVKDGVITKELKPIQSGRGITSVAKTSTVGEVDTYTITFSDATTTTFTVSNGVNGTNGKTIETWTAKSFVTGSQVFHLGKIWENTAAPAVAGDVPGTAAVWVERLSGNYTYFSTSDFTVANSFIYRIDGNVVSQAGYFATDFIKVEPSKDYEVFTPGGGYVGNFWYDENKAPISGFTSYTKTVVTSPSNARYVRLSATSTSTPTFKPVVNGFNLEAFIKTASLFPQNLPSTKVIYNGKPIDDKLAAIDTSLKDPMLLTKTVNTHAELLALNTVGTSDKGFPKGLEVYHHGLRSKVTADGLFWRTPDGYPATLQDATYVYPEWDEIRLRLPAIAKAYSLTIDAATVDLSKFTTTTNTRLVKSTEKGFDALKLTQNAPGDSEKIIFNNSGQVTLHSFLIFKMLLDNNVAGVSCHLLNSAGAVLYYRTLPTASYNGVTKYYELKILQEFAKNGTPNIADVTQIAFSISRKAGTTSASVWISSIETASFKAKVTLRFDDQRLSVYNNAYPVMDAKGFKGLIAVITGAEELGNDPNVDKGTTIKMTKSNLNEIKAKGWDLVAHSHTHINHNLLSNADILYNCQKCTEYLKNELAVPAALRSFYISPQGARPENAAKIQYKFYDAQMNGAGDNRLLMRKVEGYWDEVGTWNKMGARTGDGATAATLISYIDAMIAAESWGFIMFHDVGFASAYNVGMQDFTDLINYLDSKRNEIDVVTIQDVLKLIRPNETFAV